MNQTAELRGEAEGRTGLREKKAAAAQCYEAVKESSELELSQAHSAPHSTNSCVTASLRVNVTADAKTLNAAEERLRCCGKACTSFVTYIYNLYVMYIFCFITILKIN